MFFSKFVKLCSSVGKSPGAVAEEMGINRSTVSCWKSRKSKPTDISLQKIANYFNVPISYLLDDSDEQEKPAPDNGDELDMAEVVSRLSNEELYDLLDAVNKRLRELNR